MRQIYYYNGEESTHPIGFRIAPVNIHCEKQKIEERLADNYLGNGKYLDNGTIIEINQGDAEYFTGTLEIRIIAESDRQLKKTAKKHELPFDKRAII